MAQLKYGKDINDGFPSRFKCTPSAHGTKQNESCDYTINGLISLRRHGSDRLKEIQKCIGQVLSYYGEMSEDGEKETVGGTATVYKRLGYGYYLLITCGHNLVRLNEDTDKAQPAQKVWYLCEGAKKQKIRCKCIDWIHHEDYNLNLNHCRNDIGLILCHDVNSYYENVKINSCIHIACYKGKRNKLRYCSIDGYPSDAKGKLMGMNGSAERDYESGEWKYQELFTYPGQSGSVIYKARDDDDDDKEEEQYYIYGVHTFGNTKTQKNRGIYLTQNHIKWIKDKENTLRQKAVKHHGGDLGVTVVPEVKKDYALDNQKSRPNTDFRQKKIKKWNNKDVVNWIKSIGLSENWQQQMVDAVEESECTGQDWFAINSSKDIQDSFIWYSINSMLANRVYRKFKEIKIKEEPMFEAANTAAQKFKKFKEEQIKEDRGVFDV